VSRRRKSNISRQTPPIPAVAQPSPASKQRRWYKVDLHLHTPASRDYEEPNTSYLEWMRTVAKRGLEIVAITDHNTVAGIAAIRREIEWLTNLEVANRLTDEERGRLSEWREMANQVLVLPGFEFTATFGFHILGIFPPETSVRHLEHVLLQLKIPADKLDEGTTETGASTDVLTAYRVIHEAGGLVIAAHANSTHGVAMRNFPFGGQTKIAYTQDANLDALEVTDLDKGTRSTARFFNGSKMEYPRRMHCFHGSDAHRLTGDPRNPKRLGIGERASEFLLEEPSFESIQTLLRSKQFDRTRPTRAHDEPFDPLAAARAEGPSLVQSFHESANQRGGRMAAILSDVCAFANTVGGSIYIGANPRKPKPTGLAKPAEVEQEVQTALAERLTPPLEVKFDVVQSQGAKVLRIQVPKGPERPYCLDDYKFYVRDETESTLAVRDEVVALVREVLEAQYAARPPKNGGDRYSVNRYGVDRYGGKGRQRPDRRRSVESPLDTQTSQAAVPVDDLAHNGEAMPEAGSLGSEQDDAFYLPQVGVEIVASEDRHGGRYHSIRDLRNGHVIKNVTRKGARKLWNYAIQQREDAPVDQSKVQWRGNIGLVNCEKRAGKTRYDLALRDNGNIRVFYGVTEDGMEGRWSVFVQDEGN
jgi:hypothetical protein